MLGSCLLSLIDKKQIAICESRASCAMGIAGSFGQPVGSREARGFSGPGEISAGFVRGANYSQTSTYSART